MTLDRIYGRTFDEIIYDDATPSVVIFSRKSCHVCKSVVSVLEDLAPKYTGKISFYYADVEEDAPLFQRFSLKGVPQILFFKNGELAGKLAGKVEEEQVEAKIAAAFG